MQKLNSAQTCYNFKAPHYSPPSAPRILSFRISNGHLQPDSRLLLFFVRQTINGKLFILSSPYAVLEHSVQKKKKYKRSELRIVSFLFLSLLLLSFLFLMVKFTTGTTIGGSQGQPTHKENREEIYIPRTHNAQRQASSPLLGKG